MVVDRFKRFILQGHIGMFFGELEQGIGLHDGAKFSCALLTTDQAATSLQ